jgi:hypothetical protein
MDTVARRAILSRAASFHGALLLTVLLTPGAAAQTASNSANDPIAAQRDYVRALLQSSDARNQAWGAWIAGRDMLREMIPAIQTLVASRTASGSMAEGAALDAGLDALIQLGARVDPIVLLAVYQHRPAQALVLLANADDVANPAWAQPTNDLLLGLIAREKGLPWFASANLAIARRTPGVAAILMRDLEITVSVTVSDEGNSAYSSFDGMGVGVACGGIGLAPGLPPWATYSLTDYPQTGDAVLALGPKPIYYRRYVSSAGQTPAGSSQFRGGPDARERLTYITQLARLDEKSTPIRAFESHSVAWRGEAALTAALTRIQEDVARRVQVLIQSLIATGALTNEEAASIQPRVTFTVNDARSVRNK